MANSVITLDNVSFRYPDAGRDALSGVSLSIEAGSFIAVLGHNGSGKSTLAKLLNAILVPTEGTVTVKGMVLWAKENAKVSGLEDRPVRWIVDDCAKFVEREIRRGHKYDAIIMDPPSYGRGPGGEVWKLEDNLWDFVSLCSGVLSDDALFVLINSYTTGLAPSVLSYITDSIFTARRGGSSRAEELGLPVTQSGLVLPCGASCRWEA